MKTLSNVTTSKYFGSGRPTTNISLPTIYVGRLYEDTTTGITYRCSDDTSGLYKWESIGVVPSELITTVRPTNTDDMVDGYVVGSVWFHDGTVYKCSDNTISTAVWEIQNSSTPTVNDDISTNIIIGDVWRSTSTGKAYTCTNNADGGAVWVGIDERVIEGFIGTENFTVGATGDYTSITSALTDITARFTPQFIGTGSFVKIELQAGFVMNENIVVDSLDLSWIQIHGADALTMCTHSGWSFVIKNGAKSPRISQLFDCNNVAGGFAVTNGSYAQFGNGTGFKNSTSDGLHVISSAVYCNDAPDFSGAATENVYCRDSSIYMPGAVLSNSNSGYGLLAYGCRIYAPDAIFSGNKYGAKIYTTTFTSTGSNFKNCTEVGLILEAASTAYISSSDLSSCKVGMQVYNASRVNGSNVVIDSCEKSIYMKESIGILPGLHATGASGHAITATDTSSLSMGSSTVSSTKKSIILLAGSVCSCSTSTFESTNEDAIYLSSASKMYGTNVQLTGSSGKAVAIYEGSVATLSGLVITGNTGIGIHASGNSRFYGSADITGGTTGVYADKSSIASFGALVTDVITDKAIRCGRGSSIEADSVNAKGTTHKTGMYAYNNSSITCTGTATVNDCKENAVRAENGSTISIETLDAYNNGVTTANHTVSLSGGSSANIETCNATNSAGTVFDVVGGSRMTNKTTTAPSSLNGAVAKDGSSITFTGVANFSNATLHGIYAYGTSTIDAENALCDSAGTRGITALNGSTINAKGVSADGCGSGVQASNGSTIIFDSGNASDSVTGYGILATHNSSISADGLTANNANSIAIHAAFGSSINAQNASATGAGEDGIKAEFGSTVTCDGGNLDGAGRNGAWADGVSFITLRSATLKNAADNGIIADSASTIEAESANTSGFGVRGIFSADASTINALSAVAQSGTLTTADIQVSTGGTINAAGRTGGTNVTINTVTVAGTIFG